MRSTLSFILILIIFAFVSISILPSRAEGLPDVDKSIDAVIHKENENQIRETFEFFVEKLKDDQDRNKKKIAIDGVRMFLYNKLNIIAQCSKAYVKQKDLTEGYLTDCIKRDLDQAAILYKMGGQFNMFDQTSLSKCFFKARQFERELAFKPYDFLLVDDGRNSPPLYNFETLNNCIRNLANQ